MTSINHVGHVQPPKQQLPGNLQNKAQHHVVKETDDRLQKKKERERQRRSDMRAKMDALRTLLTTFDVATHPNTMGEVLGKAILVITSLSRENRELRQGRSISFVPLSLHSALRKQDVKNTEDAVPPLGDRHKIFLENKTLREQNELMRQRLASIEGILSTKHEILYAGENLKSTRKPTKPNHGKPAMQDGCLSQAPSLTIVPGLHAMTGPGLAGTKSFEANNTPDKAAELNASSLKISAKPLLTIAPSRASMKSTNTSAVLMTTSAKSIVSQSTASLIALSNEALHAAHSSHAQLADVHQTLAFPMSAAATFPRDPVGPNAKLNAVSDSCNKKRKRLNSEDGDEEAGGDQRMKLETIKSQMQKQKASME